MDGSANPPVVTISTAALGRVMPMHLCLDANGTILTTGPTLAKIDNAPLPGQAFFSAFSVRRPACVTTIGDLRRHSGAQLHLSLNAVAEPGLRGLALPLANDGLLVNLTFGNDLQAAVRQHRLSDADFAPTDLAVEMLWLLEVSALIRGELADLNGRLQGAKIVAEEQAQTDTLTGLRNRRAMDARLAELVGTGAPFGLMHLDLDWFKQVNDTLGHAAGDHVLRYVAQVLLSETRQGDTVARVGGDEFVIVLPGLVDPSRLDAIARRIITRLAEPILHDGHPCKVSASIGMTVSTAYDYPQPDRMLSDADEALYAAKHAGRGQARVFLR